ncbi:MAG: HAE1 family hydrophobic/amphiphilic exporter-1 [Myxococcota bacterium]|jgi:HAE1 family hydrophobic/amphiphilic exporter-1
MLRWLPELSVRRPVTVVMFFFALCVLGAIAWSRIPLELMPGRFSPSSLWLSVPYPGATPRENEAAILLPVEEQLSTLPGLKEMSGSAGSGSVSFSLEFHRSMAMDEAYNAVVDRMERTMPDLPDDVERYYIYRWNPADTPIIWAGVSLGPDVEYPYQLAEEVIKARLERVDGVGQVEVWGADPRQVYVDFSLDALSEHGVSLYEVIQNLGSDNFQLASGRMTDRGQVRYVRSLARYADLDELRRAPIREGVVVEDVAEIFYGTVSSASINRIDGLEGIGLAVSKESDANTVETAERVIAAMAELELEPRAQGTRFFTFFDQGDIIEGSIDDLLTSAAYGGAFAVIVLLAFLRDIRMTVLIAACIPFTLLLTVTWMFFNGGSLNLLSLLGLMIAVGMVVDNSIVVVESIYARRSVGESAGSAAIRGTTDVALAITLSTLTTMVVFLPVILMTEDADFSFFMGELGFPVVWALGASLLVALVFTPLTTTLLRGGEDAFSEPRWVRFLGGLYQRGLRWVLTRRSDTLLGIVAMAVLTIAVPVKSVGCQDGADSNISEFAIIYGVPASFTYAEREEIVDTYEAYVEEHRAQWGVEVHRSRLRSSETYGRTYVHLAEDRPPGMMSREDVVTAAREELPEMAGVEAQVGWSGGDQGGVPQFSIVLRGEDTETLARLGEEVRRMIRTVPGVIGALPDLEEDGGDEMRLVVDREAAARYGVGAQQIGQTVSFALRGTGLPDYHDGDIEVDVFARFRLEDRADVDRLLDFPMFSPTAMGSVPLRALVDTDVGRGLGTIRRTNRQTSWPITVDVDPDADMAVVRGTVDAALAQLSFPRGYTWNQPSFADRAEDDAARNLALLLSVTMVFLIMGVLFESFLLPLSIITTIPMALFGVYWTLYLTRTPLDVMGGVGLVILVGVVVNNGIVLIDLVTRLRETMSRTDALVEAGRRRMRPILMTALTTIFGLLPMAVGSSTFIGIPYAPMGRVVAGGMIAGTLLTLFFVPYLYSVLDDIRDSAARWAGWVARRPGAAAAAEEGTAK